MTEKIFHASAGMGRKLHDRYPSVQVKQLT